VTQFDGYDQLNPQEQQFLACLEAVDSDNIWSLAIQEVMKNPTGVKIRQLIGDLKSQEADQPDIMLSILGESCYQQLLTL
jgi:hypothetical protein